MYRAEKESGNTEYRSWLQVPENIVSGIPEGSDSTPLQNKKYSRIVYVANASDIGSDSGPAAAIKSSFSQHIVTSGNYTYVMKAVPGTDLTSASWQMSRIYETCDDILVEWADGNANFDNVASDYATKVFST